MRRCAAGRTLRGAALLCLLALRVSGSAAPPADTRAEASAQLADAALEARVDALLRQMTLDEKIGQLVQYSAGFATGPGSSTLSYDELVERGAVGSMLNVSGAEQTNHYQRIAMQRSRLHIPLLFGLDVIHGAHTIFPVPLGLASSWDPQLVATVARASAVEARAEGIQWVFAPMVDIARDPRWGRIVESAGEDPYLGAAVARSWVQGFQQGDLAQPGSVAVSVKHFAAYGAAIAGREYNATDLSDITLRQVYLPPYHAAVAAGAATLMSAFNSINGIPGSANPYLLTQILRDEWGFGGFVVSDWCAIAELLNHGIGADRATVARKALEAGVDVDMECGVYAAELAAEVHSGRIAESFVERAARRVLRVKVALGLFEHPYTPDAPAYRPTPHDRAQARAAAAESIVLLKNDPISLVGPFRSGPFRSGPFGSAPLLPLAGPAPTVALIGPLGDSPGDMLGPWRALGEPRYAVSLRQALQERLGERLLVAKGCEIGPIDEESRPARNGAAGRLDPGGRAIAAAVAIARRADLAILALGEDAGLTAEAASRTRLDLPGRQQELLEAVAATGKPIVLVLFTGRPSTIGWAAAHVPAILEAWYPGMEGGHAVADVLFGDVNPSAKLPASFPRAVGQEPLYYAQLPTGRPAHGDLAHPPVSGAEKYTSRYLDEDNAALYAFGWGLGYAQFGYGQPTLSRTRIPLDEASAAGGALLRVGVEVRNLGRVPGTEVVQLYLRNTGASVEQPVRELKGFTRVALAAGEARQVEFALGFDELSFYDVHSRRVVEPTTYQVFVGGSSLATAQASFEVQR